MTPPVERPLSFVPIARDGRLTTAVEAVSRQLCDAEDGLARPYVTGGYTHLPSRDAVAAMVGDLLTVLFPGYFGTLSVLSSEALSFHIETTLHRAARVLGDQMRRAYCLGCGSRDPAQCPECDERADGFTEAFLARLPEIRRVLSTDVTAAYRGGPGRDQPGRDDSLLSRQRAGGGPHALLKAASVSMYEWGSPMSKRRPSTISPRNPSSWRSRSSADVSWNSPRSRTLCRICSSR